jgi:DNA-binding MarR family transcriptional regulator
VRRPSGVALLLSRLGAASSQRLAARLAELDLTPAHVGVLRVVGQQPGLSQQAVAARLGAAPSRIVALVDELEDAGLVRRTRSATDRRQHELSVAPGSADRIAAVMTVVGEHDADLTRGLTREERTALLALLRKVAAAQGLGEDGHPGYGSGRSAR